MHLFRQFQLLPGVDGVRAQPIQRLDFLVPRAAAELFGSDAPERVSLDHGVGFICRCGFRFSPGQNGVDSRLHGGIVIPSVGQTIFSLRAVAPIPADDLPRQLVHRFASSRGRCSRAAVFQQALDLRTEGVHAFAVLREPVHHIAVVAGDAQFMPLTVADKIRPLRADAVLFAEIYAEFHGFLVNRVEIRGIREIVLANLEADVRVIAGALCAAASVPAAHVPRQSLIGCNRAVRQFPDEGVRADLSPARLVDVPVVVVLVLAQQASAELLEQYHKDRSLFSQKWNELRK